MTNNPLASIPILGFVGKSGSGKTTLLKSIINILQQKGLCIAVIKHSHHDFEIDKPGKDSYKLRQAGAQQTLITSKYRTALIKEYNHSNDCNTLSEPTLASSLQLLDTESTDIILVEGFKQENLAKIEVHQQSTQQPFLFQNDENIIALASDISPDEECHIPLFDINQPATVVAFILEKIIKLNQSTSG